MTGPAAASEFASETFTVTEASILAYAGITDDFNPLHVDADFAAKTPIGSRIAHGTMSLNLIWQAAARSFGLPLPRLHLTIRFLSPVRIGDRIEAGGARRPEEPGCYDVWVHNQDGAEVLRGTLSFAQEDRDGGGGRDDALL